MKRVFGVSLGSSSRDHVAEVEMLGELVELQRRGMDGDIDRAEALIREIDGSVDAIGLGGIDVYLYARGERYTIRDGLRLMEAAQSTPAVDGSGIKDTLEREAVHHLVREGLLSPRSNVLMVSGVDRFGMAEALADVGCDVTYGDLMFAAGIPYPIKTLDELADIARRILPEMTKMPFTMLYPTGSQQDDPASRGKFNEYYEAADVIAGDWHYIRKYMPDRIDGKLVFTNTTTSRDVEELHRRGARCLVTTTPVMNGRSFGTNLIEAMIVALDGRRPEEIGHAGYSEWLGRLRLIPSVQMLEEGGST